MYISNIPDELMRDAVVAYAEGGFVDFVNWLKDENIIDAETAGQILSECVFYEDGDPDEARERKMFWLDRIGLTEDAFRKAMGLAQKAG